MKFFKHVNIVTASCWQGQKIKGVDMGSNIMLNHILKNNNNSIKSICKIEDYNFNSNKGYNIVYNKVLNNCGDMVIPIVYCTKILNITFINIIFEGYL